MTRASGPEVPPTSLAGLYGTLRVGRSVTGGIFQAIGGFFNLDLGQLLGGLGRAVSLGSVDILADLGAGIETLVGRALFVTKFSSDIVGALQAVILGAYPFVALVALVPGKHIITVVTYVYLLIAVYSMPFGWSLIDLLSDIALSRANFGGLVDDPVGTLEGLGLCTRHRDDWDVGGVVWLSFCSSPASGRRSGDGSPFSQRTLAKCLNSKRLPIQKG